jgi:predicted ATPase/class 3 adenylate cyclase
MVEVERRARDSLLPSGHLTLLFADIEGSTQLVEALGEQYGEVLRRQFELMRQAISRHDGHEVIAHSDSYFAVFRRAPDAVTAAVEAQQLLFDEDWPEGVRVRVRMGLHTGDPQAVEDRAIGYTGLDVHRAARICAVGHGGQVLLSSATRSELAGDLPSGVGLRDLGTHRLKDIRFPETLFDLAIEGLPSRFAPIRSLDNRPNNLPTALTPFIGRVTERTHLHDYMLRDDVRLVTLTGTAGTGKTRLSIEVARGLLDVFVDGVFQIQLATVTVPRLVPPAIAQTLGVPEFPGRPVLDTLQHAIGERRMLLVIDNFEQVVAAAGTVVNLINGCPRLKVLLTSREPLGVLPEHEYRVAPLQIPYTEAGSGVEMLEDYDAVKLFVERVRSIRPDFALTAETGLVVADICRRLDGLPLAIELAASRLRLLDPPTLLKRLTERLAALGHEDWAVDGRHRTMRTAISWSYNLLPEPERRLFCRASVFLGGFGLEAAQRVCAEEASDEDVLDGLTSLTRKSLLQRETVEGEPRLRMLQTVREYAREQSKASGEYTEVRSRHMTHMLALVEEMAPTLVATGQRRSVGRLLTEADNIGAALEFALERSNADAISRFVKSLLWLWIPRSRFTEADAWITRALQRTAGLADTREYAAVRDVAGWLRILSGDWRGALPFFQECRPIYERLNLRHEAALTLMAEGVTKTVSTADPAGQSEVLAALQIFRELDDTYGIALSLTALGESARLRGEDETAQRHFEEALTAIRLVGNTYWISALLENLAHVRLRLGDWIGAVSLLTEALELANEFDYPIVVYDYIAAMGEVALVRGRAEEAARLFGATASFLRSLGVAFEPTDQAALERNMATARDKLGATLYEARFQEGAQWGKSQAISATAALRN